MKAFVVGNPIQQSLSPLIFTFLADILKKDLTYEKKILITENLKKFYDKLRLDPSFIGTNVTLPFKEMVKDLVDEIDKDASSAGAVNVVHHKNGKLIGYNTDIFGVRVSLDILKVNRVDELYGAQKTILIYGAGGAARSVLSCLSPKAKIIIVNSTKERIISLTNDFSKLNIDFKSEVEKIDAPIDVMINTTPVGMVGKNLSSPFFDNLASLNYNYDVVFFDLIYNPQKTAFLEFADNRNYKFINGLPMFVEQALKTWEIWFNQIENRESVNESLSNILVNTLKIKNNPKILFLCGFMGVGKSTTSKILAQLLGRDFYDLDTLIEEKTQLSIEEIFKVHGEEYFRNMERECLEELCAKKEIVVALGGGSIVKDENLFLVKKYGTLISLFASEETIYKRITQQKSIIRPLLHGLSDLEIKNKINNLLNKRMSVYEKATFKVWTDHQTPTQVCLKILQEFSYA